MLSAERASFTIALQGDESQDGESGGVSLAHYRSLVSQVGYIYSSLPLIVTLLYIVHRWRL